MSNVSSVEENLCLGMLLTEWYAFEGIIEVITLINSSALGFVLFQAKSVHINLRLACFSMCFCVICRALLRFIMITNYLCCDSFYSSTVHFWFVFVLGFFNVGSHFVELGIVVERTASMLRTKDYETWFSIYFITLVCVIPYLISFIATIFVLYLKVIGIMPANYITLASLILGWGCFFVVLKQKFYSGKVASWNPTLSERFQYYENMRTNRTMMFLCIFCLFHVAIATVFQTIRGIIMASLPSDQLAYQSKFFECLLHIIYGGCFSIFPFTFIFTIPAIRKRYRFFGLSDSRVSPQQDFVILSVTGKQLIHESTPKEHFMLLKKAWDIGFEEQKL